MPELIVLVGQRCAGKTLLGRELASLLGGDFRDLDELVAARFGAPEVREAWLALGEAGFRALEAEVLRGALAAAASDGAAPCGAEARGLVLATGGGLADNAAALETLREALSAATAGGRPRLLVLRAPLELLLPRYRERGFPPSLGPDPADEAIRALFSRREAAYESLGALPGAASLVLEEGPMPAELARRAVALLGLDPGRSAVFR